MLLNCILWMFHVGDTFCFGFFLLRCQIINGKLNKRLWSSDKEPIFLYSLCQNDVRKLLLTYSKTCRKVFTEKLFTYCFRAYVKITRVKFYLRNWKFMLRPHIIFHNDRNIAIKSIDIAIKLSTIYSVGDPTWCQNLNDS